MRATGIVRRVDDLGRIVIPKEIRRQYNIVENTPMEYYTFNDGIAIKIYNTEPELNQQIDALLSRVEEQSADLGYEKTGMIRCLLSEVKEQLNK